MKTIKLTTSKNPRKQRKVVAAAPLHIKQKFMTSILSKELRKKQKRRNYQLRKGDEVKVMRGQFRGKTGKVSRIMLQKTRAYVEGAENIKKDGSKTYYPIHPSNLMIIKLESDDKRRNKTTEKK